MIDTGMSRDGCAISRATTLTKELAMDKQPDTIREAVGVFTSANDLQAAIDELLSSGFHRAELSLLAGEEAVNEKLGGGFANVRAVEDDPVVPRTAYVSPEAIGDAQGGIVGGLVYAGATVAAGAVADFRRNNRRCHRRGNISRRGRRHRRRAPG